MFGFVHAADSFKIAACAPGCTDEDRVSRQSVLRVQLADLTPAGELVPSPLEKHVHHAVARAVAETAIRLGIARADYVP